MLFTLGFFAIAKNCGGRGIEGSELSITSAPPWITSSPAFCTRRYDGRAGDVEIDLKWLAMIRKRSRSSQWLLLCQRRAKLTQPTAPAHFDEAAKVARVATEQEKEEEKEKEEQEEEEQEQHQKQ